MKGLKFAYIELQPEDLGFDPEVVYRAEPSGGPELYYLLRKFNIQSSDAIVDIGCGQGSAMRTMHHFPFKKIDGFEKVEEIADIAIRNFELLKSKRCNVYLTDPTAFKSYEDYSIFYFFNPFPEEVLVEVMTQIEDSIKDSSREHIIIYVNSEFHETIIANNRFNLIVETKVRWHITSIYSTWSKDRSRLKHLT